MNILPKLVLPAVALSLLSVAAFGESSQELLSQAQAAYLRGDLDTARQQFELVNRLDPRNVTAIGYLRMIKAQQAKGGGGAQIEKQLSTVIMPQVQFRDATLGAALEFLRLQVKKASNDKVAVNFVVQLPEAQAQTQTVTLNLTNVPFTEVLKYLGGVANISFVYDKYAIIVRPAGTAAAAPASTAKPVQ